MRRSVEFLIGLLGQVGPAFLTREDQAGLDGRLLRLWQEHGIIAIEGRSHPAASCPHCGEGVPYRPNVYFVCSICGSTIDDQCLCVWEIRREAFFVWLSHHLQLRGSVRSVDGALWQLGTGVLSDETFEWFFHGAETLSEHARATLAGYRRTVTLHGPFITPGVERPGQWVPVIELFDADGMLLRPVPNLLRGRGQVRFDSVTGALTVGTTMAGEVPLDSREYTFLKVLAIHLNDFVAYADLQRAVLRHHGGSDGLDAATFCHKLKNRMKKMHVPGIDRLLVASHRADGYRLRAEGEL
jgi:hypothetical protein